MNPMQKNFPVKRAVLLNLLPMSFALRISRSACVLFPLAIVFLTGGCVTSVKSSAVKPGPGQYPTNVRPLIFVNLRVESELKYFTAGKAPLVMDGFLLENAVTHERTPFTFTRNPFTKGSVQIPFKVDYTQNAVYKPAVISVKPGEYYFRQARIYSTRPDMVVASFIEFKEDAIKLTVPDEDFVSWGTVLVTLKEKKGTGVGDILQGFKIESNEKHVAQSYVSPAEQEFALTVFPFLQNRNLNPSPNQQMTDN